MLVQLDQFEGPLGLLLFLIRKEEMDIYDIPIHRITTQYLEYIKQLPSFDLEQAGDFVAMAASLIQIKAKMLLPNYDENGEELEVEDPRKPLVDKLLEYQKYQEASRDLYERPLLGRDLLKRGRKEEIEQDDAGIEMEESALFSLIAMYRDVIRKSEKAQHRVAASFQSIASRILEIASFIRPGKRITLRNLITPSEWTATKYLISFLSLLELGKLGYVNLFQSEDCGDIHIEGRKEIEGDVVQRVAEYDDGLEKVAADFGVNTAVVEESPSTEVVEEEMASDDEIAAAESSIIEADAIEKFESNDPSSGIDIDSINELVESSLNDRLEKQEQVVLNMELQQELDSEIES